MARTTQVGKLLAAGVVACALLAADASAGTYAVWSCRGPAGEPLSAAAWAHRTVSAKPGDVVFDDSCAQGGALSVALATGRSFDAPVVGMAAFAAPSGTRIAGYELWRSLAAAPPELLPTFDYAAAVTESAAGASTRRGCATHSSTCRSAGDPGEPMAAANRVTAQAPPLDAVALEVSCQWGWCGKPSGTPARAELYRARVDVSDGVAPAPPTLGGVLASGSATLSGAAELTVASSDPGAGIASVSLAIDGGTPRVVHSGDAHPGCREPYVTAPPCPTAVAHTFVVDAATLAAGPHTASGVVVDAAGNQTPWGPVAFTVGRDDTGGAGGPPPGADPPAPPARLRLRAPRSRAPGKAATISGRLRSASGAPIAAAPLVVTAVDLGVSDARTRRLAAVTTDARGRFTARLDRDGAQRVTVSYVARPGAEPTARASVRVRTRLSLSAAPRPSALVKGRTLIMRGRLRGAGRSARGAVVQIQAIVNGRWAPVGVARARANGRYRWRYRFVNLTRDTAFSFRGVVQRAPGWPWRSVRSGRVAVRVDVP